MELVYEKKLYQSRKNTCFDYIQNSGKSEFFRLQQSSVINFLVAKKCKPCEICRKTCDVYREACFSPKNAYIQ